MTPLDNMSKTQRLAAVAAELRAQAIESKLSLAITFCDVAETHVSSQRLEKAYALLEQVQRTAESVHYHLNVPNHLPPGRGQDIRYQLANLETRILKVRRRLLTSPKTFAFSGIRSTRQSGADGELL